MPQYMLLLHSDPASMKNLSPAEMQSMLEKYLGWRSSLQKRGILRGSQKLANNAGKVLRGRNPSVRVTDGPYSETKEALGGYFLIEQSDYDDAVEAARGCPLLEYGGTIEVRQVDENVPRA